MDVRIFTEPQQGATYDELLSMALATESAGFDAFFRSDHKYANEFNLAFQSPEQARVILRAVDEACEAIGRDPKEIKRSIALQTVCGRDGAECKRRALAIGRELDGVKARGLAGTPREIAERLKSFAALGISRVNLQMLDVTDLERVQPNR